MVQKETRGKVKQIRIWDYRKAGSGFQKIGWANDVELLQCLLFLLGGGGAPTKAEGKNPFPVLTSQSMGDEHQ